MCSCVPGYIGSPPTCRPECVVSSECALNEACVNQKCINPCPGTCGVGAKCQVVNHNPICSCSPRFTGDPFIRCYAIRKQNIYILNYIYIIYTTNTLNSGKSTYTSQPVSTFPLRAQCSVPSSWRFTILLLFIWIYWLSTELPSRVC